MKKKYNGYTLVELIICLILIGILTTVGISVIKPNKVNKKYQLSSLYHYLDQAFYNGIQNPQFNPFMYSGANANTEKPKRLCKALTYYINAKGAKDASKDGTAASCNNGSPAPLDGNDNYFTNTNSRTPYFTTSNGYEFFITPMRQIQSANDTEFFIIYVDINGTKGSNTVGYIREGDKVPDIYAFAALPIGKIIPLGIMETDSRFLTAYITYPNPNENQYTETISGKNVPYYVAKSQAWGLYSTITDHNELMKYDGNEAYSYNDYIRSVLGNSKIYQDNTIPAISLDNDDETIHFATKTDGNRVQVCDPLDRSKCEVNITRYYY